MIETVTEFPNFRTFTIDDIDWYYQYYLAEGLNPYVDIHPENMVVWLNIYNDLMISRLDNKIILKYTNVLGANHFNILPVVNSLNNSFIEKLMAYLHENHLPLELHEVPSISCRNLDPAKWSLEDDRNNYEYILDVNQQVQLVGGHFKTHRRCVNTFEREHKHDLIEVIFHKKFTTEVLNTFLRHIDTMPFNHNDKMSQENIVEPIAIRRNLQYAFIFHKKALEIKINNKTVSLAMISYIDNRTAAINHLKVDYSVKDIFKYTNYQLAKNIINDGIEEMNIEQDLGAEGMRMFKENMQPSRLLEKRIIRPRIG